jgi:uncharacterized membrane protein YiaA
MKFFTRKKATDSGITKNSGVIQAKKGKRGILLAIDKRQTFVLGTIVLSLGLFLAEFQFQRAGIVVAIILGILTDLILYRAIKEDLEDNFSIGLFILPFFYSLAFTLFYFLLPTRILIRLILTSLYAFGLYSLFLSENIFTVGAIRTIALMSGARIVSFVLTLLSYFFLTNTLFSLHLWIFLTIPLLALYTYPLVYQALWSYDLQKNISSLRQWAAIVSLCIIEVAIGVWFWPSSATVIALFLAGFLYTLVGLSHVWFEKKLFRSVMWEYVWVGVVVVFVLMLFTSWGK